MLTFNLLHDNIYIPSVCKLGGNMSRNKNPEETYELILDVSTKLFLNKGYEKTSLQDIITNLGGLTKGAIYHHFKSKEEILIAVVNRICSSNYMELTQILNDKSLLGKEKLEKMYSKSLSSSKQKDIFSIVPNLLDNPTFLSIYLKKVLSDAIPNYIVPIIKEGVDDGSIKTDYPDEFASMILFLSDVWLNPLIFPTTNEELFRKILLLNDFLKPFDICIFDDASLNRMLEYQSYTQKK